MIARFEHPDRSSIKIPFEMPVIARFEHPVPVIARFEHPGKMQEAASVVRAS